MVSAKSVICQGSNSQSQQLEQWELADRGVGTLIELSRTAASP
jgi:hypothetical protein